MRLSARAALPALLLLSACVTQMEAQDGGFQLPVQLIGFPVIIMAVRLSNFMKKLAYAVNPRTYRSRVRRAALGGGSGGLAALADAASPDPATVEKLLLGEFGSRVCVYERVCAQYAQRALDAHGRNHLLDWDTVFSRYKNAPNGEKQNYLLSVFLGDMVRSPALCFGLAKRGRSCTAMAKTTANHLPEDHHQHNDRHTTTTTQRPSRRVVVQSQRQAPRAARRGGEVNHPRGRPEAIPAEHHVTRPAPVHPQPVHRQPVHRQPVRPGGSRRRADHRVEDHSRADHGRADHTAEVHRRADRPAQVARRPRPAYRHPTSQAE